MNDFSKGPYLIPYFRVLISLKTGAYMRIFCQTKIWSYLSVPFFLWSWTIFLFRKVALGIILFFIIIFFFLMGVGFQVVKPVKSIVFIASQNQVIKAVQFVVLRLVYKLDGRRKMVELFFWWRLCSTSFYIIWLYHRCVTSKIAF
jgi:hypothetical protein